MTDIYPVLTSHSPPSLLQFYIRTGSKEGLDPGSVLAIEENEGVSFEGHRCPQCGHTVLSMEQLRRYNLLRDLRRVIPEKRKIVRIGNSLGITLPNILKDYGMQVGRDVEIEVIDPANLHIRLC